MTTLLHVLKISLFSFMLLMLEAIERYYRFRLRFGVIPVDIYGIKCRLRAWELVLVGALLLCDKCAEMSVDCYVC